jgi:hypothetical protein
MATAIKEPLTKYVTDAHSIEEQALAQLRTRRSSPAIPRFQPRTRLISRRRRVTSGACASCSTHARRGRRAGRTP